VFELRISSAQIFFDFFSLIKIKWYIRF